MFPKMKRGNVARCVQQQISSPWQSVRLIMLKNIVFEECGQFLKIQDYL